MSDEQKQTCMQRGDLHFLGEGIITFREKFISFGHLMVIPGRGVFEPCHGRVPVLPAEAELHNRTLCDAELTAIDRNCQVGQCGLFYFDDKTKTVVTFLGDKVSDKVVLKDNGRLLFRRKGKVFSGKLVSNGNLLKFRRIK